MRTRYLIAILAGCGLGLALSQISINRPAQSQEAKKPKDSAESAELSRLKASAGDFEKAFNAGDAKAIAALFTDDAEAIDEDGEILKGRTAIEARFASLFKEHPKAHIDVELTSLRIISSDVAIEDGFSAATLDPDDPGGRSPYTVVHLRRNGKWLIASVRDFPEEGTGDTAHEQLRELQWLVGHWVDESPEGRVETTCKWSEDGNYLLQDYAAKSRWGGAMKGTQRIAWDPVRQTIRSWAFDQSGAFTQATWTPVDDTWIVNAEGVTVDGREVSVTRVITPSDNDTFQMESTNLIVGQELLPDSTIRVVRRPPAPAE